MPVAEAWELSVNRDEIPPGTLYLLILKTVALHGDSLNSSRRSAPGGRGLPYPALQRMLIKGWASQIGNAAATGGRAVRLTESPQAVVREVSQFEAVTGAITRVIQTA